MKEIFDELPEYKKLGDKTVGQIRDADGKVIPGTDTDELRMLKSGEGDKLHEEANELRERCGGHPPGGSYDVGILPRLRDPKEDHKKESNHDPRIRPSR